MIQHLALQGKQKSKMNPDVSQKQDLSQTNNQITTFQEHPEDEQRQALNFDNSPSLVSIEEDAAQKLYPHSHGENFGWLSKVFFLHLTKYSFLLKTRVLDKQCKIEEKHLPKLSESESLTNTPFPEILVWGDLIKEIFLGELKLTAVFCFLTYAIESIAKSGITLVMSDLIKFVGTGELEKAYIYAIILSFLNMISLFSRHHGCNQAMVFSSKVRMTLINLVFRKLTQLSTYSIREANIGQILNLISGDIHYLEYVFITLFQSSVALITVLLGCYILWNRFESPVGMLALVIIFIAYPIQIFLQSFNSQTLKLAKEWQDKRLKFTNEFIEGIKLIKMYAWERAFQQLILVARSHEFGCYIKINVRSAIDRLFSLIAQIWSSYIFFIILFYCGFKKEMNVAEMVSTISYLSFFKYRSVFIVSQGIKAIINIQVSFQRIANILNIQNKEMARIDNGQQIEILKTENVPTIQLQDFTAYWTSKINDESKPVLKNITINMNEGEICAVLGRVGSGKSSFLNALLSEIPYYSGSYKLNGKEINKGDLEIAYVEQEPFIFPDTVKNNILFGRKFNKALYQKVLQASQLEHDLLKMNNYDSTEIGERGTTLSGGQKARISLARALYQQADLYLFDDPLSAVDSTVAKNIFHYGIKEFIFQYQPHVNPNKIKPIVFLVTHQIQYAIECDKIAILSEGQLIASGTYDEVKLNLESMYPSVQDSKQSAVIQRSAFLKSTKIIKKKESNLICKEADQHISVNKQTYFRYFKHQKFLPLILVLCLESCSEVILNFYTRIVSLFDSYQQDGQIDYAYFILGMLTLSLFFVNLFKYVLNSVSILRSVQKLHEEMISSISLAPPSYFDVNPSGRIINRFSNDVSLCDNQTNNVTLDIIETIGGFIFSLITLTILQPYFLIMIAFITIIDWYLFSYSKIIISQLREIELMQRSPLFDFLKKTLGGVTQIRVYNQQDWFRNQFFELANKCNLKTLTYYYSTRCFAFNIDLIGFIAQTVGIFIFLKLSSTDLAIFSQGILLLTTYNDGLQYGLGEMISFSTLMNSYNRMFQIIDINPEAPHHKEEDNQYKDFPKNGEIKFDNVYLKYRKESDLVLKGLNFTIKDGEKIGIVGRTGSGKSSILYAIFRMAEIESAYQSTLTIGDVDIRQLGLHKLRSSIGIIPQSPFIFPGSVRRNLDPFNQFDDETIWKVLQDTELNDYVKSLKLGLNTEMGDSNSIFSVGQKQLICLARVILQKRKIIVLDEATANVDIKTDDFIQETLKQKFSDCTLITIAHRLNTIADYDKVMVVNDGKVTEFDSPFNLLAQTEDSTMIDQFSDFSRLVKQTGDFNAQTIFNIAKNKKLSQQ